MPLIYYITKRNPVTAVVEVVVDTNFNRTSLLLSSAIPDTTTSAITDASPNQFLISTAGEVSPSPFNPYGSNRSNYFDGSGDYLSYGTNAAFTFSTGDFTVEAWVYITAATNFNIFNVGGTATGSYSLYWLGSVQKFESTRYGDAAGSGKTTNTYSLNTWYHIAAVRLGGTAKIYINGVEDTGATYSMGNITATAAESGRIWQLTSTSTASGYISNLRVVNGTAVYTSNFTPSTSPLTAAMAGTSWVFGIAVEPVTPVYSVQAAVAGVGLSS